MPLSVLVALTVCIAALDGFPTPPRTEWPDDPGSRIEWKADWQTTLEANTRRWQEELLADKTDRAHNQRTYALRLLRLKAALLGRFPADDELRVRTIREVAEGLRGFGLRRDACRWWRYLVEVFPGRCDRAIAALLDILRSLGSEPGQVDGGEAFARYASGRLLSLAAVGRLPPDSQAVVAALQTTFSLSLSRLDFWAAAHALERLRGLADERWWQEARARLFYTAGHLSEAQRLYQCLVETDPDYRPRFRLPRARPRIVVVEPSVPADAGLEAEIEAIRRAGAQVEPKRVAALVARAAETNRLAPAGPRLYRSLWKSAEETARGAAQGPASSNMPAREGDLSDSLTVWRALRRAPWSRRVHEALVGVGERVLRRGHYGIAARCFEDVRRLARSQRPAAAAARGLAIIERAESASGRGQVPAPALSQVTPRDLLLPPAPPWPADPWLEQDEALRVQFAQPKATIVAHGDHLVVSGPNLLAVYRRGGNAPTWWRACQSLPPEARERERRENVTVVPGPFVPALTGRRIYTRWGLDPGGQVPGGLAAFDLEGGELLWATGDGPQWRGLWPLTDPVVADGCLYVLAIRRAGPLAQPCYLVCLDARDGRFLWRRLLGFHTIALSCAEGSPRLRRGLLALAWFGSGLTVSRGAVYCATDSGTVARLDARDGLPEWVRTYERVRLGPNLLAVLRRRGARPLVVGRAVVFAPRDYQGAFALDKASGELLWDRPFVPSAMALGVAGHLVVLAEGRRIVALEAETGGAAWEREFAEPLTCPPVLSSGTIYAATARRLYRLSARTGASIERRNWPGEPVESLGVASDGIVAFSDLARVVPGEGGPMGPEAKGPLRLPVRRAWMLRRPGARLLPSPTPSVVLLFSGGLLECLETDGRARVRWRRLVPGGFHNVVHQGQAAVFVYPSRVLAIDMRGGRRLWETKLDFRISSCQRCGPRLFLSGPPDRLGGAMVEVASGRLLWHREFANSPLLGRGARNGTVAWDGENLHFLATDFKDKEKRLFSLVVRPRDGRVEAADHLPMTESKRLRRIVVGEGFAFGLRGDVPILCRLPDRSIVEFKTRLTEADARTERVAVEGRYICLWTKGRRHTDPSHTIVLRSDAPDRGFRIEGSGTLVGDNLFVTDARTIRRTDLRSGAETRYEIPASGGRFAGVLGLEAVGDRLLVVGAESIHSPARSRPVILHVFDLASGRHIASQPLRGLGGTRNDVAFTPGFVLVTDFAGLHAFAPGHEEGPGPLVAWRADGPIAVDGSLDDWNRTAVSRFGRAELRAAHDDENLYLAISTTDRDPVPRVGPRPSGTGDSVEVGLLTNLGTWHFELGVGPTGKLTCRPLWDGRLPPGLTAALRLDAPNRRVHYELAVPLSGIVRRQWRGWDRMAFEACAWDDSRRAAGFPHTASTSPAIPGGPLRRDAAEPLVLHRLSRREHEAAMAIVDKLPDLPASFEFIREELLSTATGYGAFATQCWRFIERHPRSRSAQDALFLYDSFLRRTGIANPVDIVVARGRRAGMPAEVLERYRRTATAYISQWAFLPKGPQPRALVIEADDGLRNLDSWGHRAYWGALPMRWRVPPTHMGPREALPIGSWRELRIPLIAIGLHDKPICALGFVQQGGGRIAWDTTAVCVDGKRHVILDDPPAPGKPFGDWEWTSEYAHSGREAHWNPPPPRPDAIRSHHIELSRPVLEHMLPWPAGPVLSQWVYLDPRNPPRMLCLDLHDGHQWHFTALWGEKLRDGFHLGPLPPAGRWVELRVPLGITPLARRPIAGVAFGQVGGRAFWDKTTVVVGGRETVLLDDSASPLQAASRQPLGWLRPREGRYVGLARPTVGVRGVALRCDGLTVHREIPHSDRLEPQNLTVECWVKLDALTWTGHAGGWVVNKNRHELADGHYALVVSRDMAGAYLNIGGGQQGKYSAWSTPGTIAPGQWNHLAMTYDGADLCLYADGKLVGRTPVNKPRTPGTTSLHIGERQDGYCHLRGTVDEVWVYDRALSPEEIALRRVAAGAPPKDPAVSGAVVAHVGFDADATIASPPRDWRWVSQPVKSGKRAVELRPEGGFAACALAAHGGPVTCHLPFETKRARQVLKTHIPRLGGSEAGWKFLLALLAMAPNARERVGCLEWFLRGVHDHPREAEALAMLRQALGEADEASAEARLREFIARRGFSPRTLYDFHRRYLGTPRDCVREWQILGPFPNPKYPKFGPTLPPDGAPVRLGATFEGARGPVTWKPYLAPSDYVDLDPLLEPNEYVVAYAACWVRAPKAQPVFLAVGSDDDSIVWLNGREVLRGDNISYARPGAFIAPATLKAGWNEILVKITEEYETWGFYFEILDPDTFRKPEGIRISPEPPR